MVLPTNHGSNSRANGVDSLIKRLGRVRPADIVDYIATYLEAGRITRRIDPGALADMERRFADASPTPGYSKYLDVRFWMHAKLRRVRALGLHKAPYRRVLDVGTGTGYFPFLAKLQGNDAIGLDVDVVPFFNAMIALLGVERRAFRIEPFQPLPDLGRFDLVTAFQICFDEFPNGGVWGVSEWDFFRRDVESRLLKPGGRMVLEFNGLPAASVADYFAGTGAKIVNSVVTVIHSDR